MVRLRVTATVRLAVLVNCVNPQYSCGPAWLLLSCDGLKVSRELPLGHAAGNRTVCRNVRPLAEGHAGDRDFDGGLLTASSC